MTMNNELDGLRKEAMVICSVSRSDGDLCCVAALAIASRAEGNDRNLKITGLCARIRN